MTGSGVRSEPRRATAIRRPRAYFSFRSPYSWLAHTQLVQERADLAAAIEWRPFWEPDPISARMLVEAGGNLPYAEMSRAKHLYVLQDVKRLARDRALALTWPVDRDPVWEVPHLAYLLAADAGHGPAFAEAVYRARWLEGRDICAPETIACVAERLGLPPDRLAQASEDGELRERGVQALLHIDRDAVFGVPFFIHGFEKFWGVDRLAAFIRSVDRARDAQGGLGDTAVPAEPHRGDGTRGGDQGHAGGCG